MENENAKIKTFIPWDQIEPEAQEQIKNTASMPFIHRHIAVMPDCHFGKGATVGTVMPTVGAIVPAAVGVDIGCGMIAVKTNLKTDRDEFGDEPEGIFELDNRSFMRSIREGIERRIPMSAGKFNNKITPSAQKRIEELNALAEKFGINPDSFDKNWQHSLGTLGGGNHFVEICTDEAGRIWATLHSGSRGVGNKIGNHFIKVAQEECRKSFIQLPDQDLAYLVEGTENFDSYMKHLNWAQHFALLNREEMMDRVLTEISYAVFGEDGHQAEFEVERINSHHNFTQIENHLGGNAWITRKGAIKADEGVKAMIPGSMGARSYIVSGLGNKVSFCSAPHGAGRRMSRAKASAQFTMEDLAKRMEGIEYRVSDVLIDEIPDAYKDIDQVMEHAKELVKIEHTLKQVINCKGD